MKTTTKIAAMFAAFAVGGLAPAYAAGTAAGTTISNKATVNYSVGGVAQTPVESSPTGNNAAGAGSGANTNFLVDRKLALTVTEQDAGTTVNVSPGQSATVLKFTVTNTGNDTQDVLFQAIQRANGTTGSGTATDNFNSTNTRVFVDSNNNGTYDSGTDTALFADELAADGSKTVFIVSDIPLTQIDGDAAKLSLVAQVAAGGGAGAQGLVINADTNGHTSPAMIASNGATVTLPGIATTSAENATTVQNVFADLSTSGVNSTGTADTASNGQASDTGTLLVISAKLTVTKTSKVVSDPINSSNPKAIPGAVVEYCIILQNTGTQAASPVSINDSIPANTTYVPSSMRGGVTVAGGVCTSGTGTALSDPSDGDNGSFVSSAVNINFPSPGVAAGTTTAASFQVTIN
ncbi:MAG: hypothetical protein V4607_05360 [Pseudomonadota bacterium]